MNELVTRLISGIIFIAILLFGTTYSQTSFFILYLSLGFISIYEMWNILEKKNNFAFCFRITSFYFINKFNWC